MTAATSQIKKIKCKKKELFACQHYTLSSRVCVVFKWDTSSAAAAVVVALCESVARAQVEIQGKVVLAKIHSREKIILLNQLRSSYTIHIYIFKHQWQSHTFLHESPICVN